LQFQYTSGSLVNNWLINFVSATTWQ